MKLPRRRTGPGAAGQSGRRVLAAWVSASGDGGAAWNAAPGDRSTPAARTGLMRVAAMPRAVTAKPPMTSSMKWLAEARTTNVVAAG